MPEIPRLPKRDVDSHKGTYGRLLLIGGSRGMAGSISLTGMAALRSGAGLVTIATANSAADTVASFDPCYMTLPLSEDSEAPGIIGKHNRELLAPFLKSADCVAIGPGIGDHHSTRELVTWLFTSFDRPLVIDADAINCLSHRDPPLADAGGPRILTPHPGEFLRLTKIEAAAEVDLTAAANQLAKDYSVVVVLKGHQTTVTDGHSTFENQTGNPGMATGGSGDVLTGVIAAIIGQGMSPYDAAVAGVHIHGLSGDIAAANLGQIGMTARDIAAYLPKAFCETM
jgi:NAD(P)H-hydrate epimerase